MRTPVIIPAFNEERSIGQTLKSLPSELVEPFVAVNGSNDGTAAIADQLGARVLLFEKQGKLPAIQATLRQLGDKALEPLIILDADTRPWMPKRWHEGMMKHLANTNPAVVGGPIWFSGGGVVNSMVRSLYLAPANLRAKILHDESIGQAGPNMGIRISNKEILEEILALPHYWRGEDRALVHVIRTSNGTYSQPLDPGMHTTTRFPSSFPPLRERLHMSLDESIARSNAHYALTGAPGSIPFEL